MLKKFRGYNNFERNNRIDTKCFDWNFTKFQIFYNRI